MSSLSKDDVKHVAKLSSLPISDEEVEVYEKQLSEVVNYIDELKNVDVSNTEPTSQTTGLVNVTREDTVNPIRTLSQDEAISGAENVHNGFFKVPPTIAPPSGIKKLYDDQ